MDLQNLLKQFKSNPKGKNENDYLEFLDKAMQFQEKMFVDCFNHTLMMATYKLLASHLLIMERNKEYLSRFMEFIGICLKFNKEPDTINFLKDYLKTVEHAQLSMKLLGKICLVSKDALESNDFQALNLIWKSILKIITRDISLEMKHFLFLNAFMDQLKILLKNNKLDSRKYYGLLAFYLGHLNAFVKFSTTVLIGQEDVIIGFLISTG